MINHVRAMRKKQKLSQCTLAKMSGVGQVTISNIETERYVPRADVALAIANALNCTVEDLFVLDGMEKENDRLQQRESQFY